MQRELGDYSVSVKSAGECMQEAEEIGSLSCAAMASLALGESQLGLDRTGPARDTLERGMELSVQSHMDPVRLAATDLLSSIAGRFGQLDLARPGWEGTLEAFGRMGDSLSVAHVLVGRADALVRGPEPDPAAALADLDMAVAMLERMEARPRLARALRARGRVLHQLGREQLGREAEADASLARAAALAAEMGLRDGPWPASVGDLDRLIISLEG